MAGVFPDRPKFEIAASDHWAARKKNKPLRTTYRSGDLATERFLLELAEFREQQLADSTPTGNWLLAFRRDFQAILSLAPCRGLQQVLQKLPPESPVFPVALWLQGRCSTRMKSHDLESLPAEATPTLRKHFAKALYRVEAWPRLRRLANDYPNDPFVAAMKSCPFRRSLASRIARYAEHVSQPPELNPADHRPTPLWIRDSPWTLTPPKSNRWIRMMLERIRVWVRGVH
ncbi:hypothetical protein [Aeoliella mucimassa]|uniref:hypothetical protein n=1 Tax=Aeoliella mucimassa TaxID=2527972 RepID=UPI0011AB1DB3|nr:hypothetical protein [Aeoliella mucimassa]